LLKNLTLIIIIVQNNECAYKNHLKNHKDSAKSMDGFYGADCDYCGAAEHKNAPYGFYIFDEMRYN